MIKFVVFDFDGVFTNCKTIIDNEGKVIKHYNVRDGMGISLLKKNNINIGVISGYEENNSQLEILKHLKINYVSLGTKNKLIVLQQWCDKLGIDIKTEVAYMGDDVNDLEVMNVVKLVGCPKDAHDECLKIAQFISTKNGGDGCIREFCEYILEIKKRYELKITAVIPSRKGSTRCINKNLRKFGNTNLLQNKISILKNCKYIDKILVNSNDDKALNIAEYNNVGQYKRDKTLCVGDVAPSDVHVNLASNIDTDILVYNTPVSPFIKSSTIDTIIKFWRDHPEYDIVLAGTSIKNFIWNNNKPYNFKIKNGIVGTQELSDNFKISRADSMLIGYKNNIIKNKCLFGNGEKLYVYEINELEGIDIDWNLDFVISESLFHRSLTSSKLIENYMKNTLFKETKILDCTIRDSGYLNNWNWSYDVVKKFLYYMGEIGIEYCEIGFLKKEKYVEKNAGIWRNLSNNIDIINKLKQETKTKTKIALMLDIGGIDEEYYDVNDLDSQDITNIDLIRVFTFINIIDKSITICNILKKKGYTVSLNIGHCAHLEYDELKYIKNLINIKEINIDYLYFADSLGMLTPNEINSFMINLKDIYPIKNGFHNHNNNGTVFGNLINLINCNIDILDGTISGFGKNGGNANFEQLIMYLCLKENYTLKIESLLEFLEKIKDVDFGENNKIDMNQMKSMLQQFMNVHSSYLNPIKDKPIISIYHTFLKLENKKKIW